MEAASTERPKVSLFQPINRSGRDMRREITAQSWRQAEPGNHQMGGELPAGRLFPPPKLLIWPSHTVLDRWRQRTAVLRRRDGEWSRSSRRVRCCGHSERAGFHGRCEVLGACLSAPLPSAGGESMSQGVSTATRAA